MLWWIQNKLSRHSYDDADNYESDDENVDDDDENPKENESGEKRTEEHENLNSSIVEENVNKSAMSS